MPEMTEVRGGVQKVYAGEEQTVRLGAGQKDAISGQAGQMIGGDGDCLTRDPHIPRDTPGRAKTSGGTFIRAGG
jgi:hypothetical protein